MDDGCLAPIHPSKIATIFANWGHNYQPFQLFSIKEQQKMERKHIQKAYAMLMAMKMFKMSRVNKCCEDLSRT
jgi:hypothetical protein